MDFDAFHFAEPLWLLGLIAIPAIFGIYFLFYRHKSSFKRLNNMIDPHLIPYLLVNKTTNNGLIWKWKVFSCSLIWACLILALAGPRWNYREIDMMSKDQSLIILLDLSESMNGSDVAPSRLIRARQKIEDLISHSSGIKIGLIAFAADPHIITPLTEDKESVRHLLHSLSTDLVHVQGSRLTPALKMAASMMEDFSNHYHDLVLITDGGFEDKSAIMEVKKLKSKGISVHVIGIGTLQGAVLRDGKGNTIKKNGSPILSKLERGDLQEIGRVGDGFYIEPGFTVFDESIIIDKLKSQTETINTGKKMRLWDEGYYLFLIPALPIFLYWFRRGVAYLALAGSILCPGLSLDAEIISDFKSCFINSEETGAENLKNGDYAKAAEAFQDPYRKGVALYKAGNFIDAEKMFRQADREEVSLKAGYNLGNALAYQKKFDDAIAAYEEVLKKWPEFQPAKDNLELIRKIKNQQSQDKKNNENNENKQDNQPDNNDEDSHDAKKEEGKEDQSGECNSEESDSESNLKDKPNPSHEESLANINEDSKESEDNSSLNDEKKDQDADVWLNRISNEPKDFLRNKFFIESKKNGTREGIDPW